MNKIICFRFDVDTIRCWKRGVPYLLQKSDEFNCKFNFFFNCGKAISLKAIRSIFSKRLKVSTHSKFSSTQKQGIPYLLYTILLNPSLANRYSYILKRIETTYHLTGLHGGINHSDWMYNAHDWPLDKLIDEVQWGIKVMNKFLPHTQIDSFSSPGWNSPSKLKDVLLHNNITLLADMRGNNHDFLYKKTLKSVNTHLTSEPGGVGYFEGNYAKGYTNDSIIHKLLKDIENCPSNIVTVYDHPCFIEKFMTNSFGNILADLINRGYRIERLDEYAIE